MYMYDRANIGYWQGATVSSVDRTNGTYPVALIHSHAEANDVHDHENLCKREKRLGR